MYINPFLAGIIATLSVEALAFVVLGVVLFLKEKRNEESH